MSAPIVQPPTQPCGCRAFHCEHIAARLRFRGLRRRRPPCCEAGAVAAPGACPWHDSWRRVLFLAPNLPTRTDDGEDDRA